MTTTRQKLEAITREICEAYGQSKLAEDPGATGRPLPAGVVSLRDIERFYASRGVAVIATLGPAGMVQIEPRIRSNLRVEILRVPPLDQL